MLLPPLHLRWLQSLSEQGPTYQNVQCKCLPPGVGEARKWEQLCGIPRRAKDLLSKGERIGELCGGEI